jgi:hypothetical protein
MQPALANVFAIAKPVANLLGVVGDRQAEGLTYCGA